MSASPPDSNPPRSDASASSEPRRSGPPPQARRRRPDRLIGSVLDGKFEIIEKIGEGGMGSVYTANQLAIDRKVAVKVLLGKLVDDEISVRRFEQEAKAVSKINHPHTVTIFDFGRAQIGGEENLYIAMEYLRGRTLTRLLRQDGALVGRRAARIIRQVCESLSDAHGAGIIHRDLKPDNIFLTEVGGIDDFVKVLDFGVAKLAGETSGTLTQTGMIFGTPKYMSPEQAEGKPIDYRADIYAIGVVLYELLVGKPPFAADTPVALLLKHISEPPPPMATLSAKEVDPRLEAIVRRALEKDPDKRYQQVTELALELEQYERSFSGPQFVPEMTPRQVSAIGAPLPTSDLGPDALAAAQTKALPSSGLSSELSGLNAARSAPKRSRAGLIGGIVAVAAIAVGLGAFSYARRTPAPVVTEVGKVERPVLPEASKPKAASEPGEQPSDETPTTETVAPVDKVRVSFRSRPRGAAIWLGGQQLGVTPVTVELEPRRERLTFTFRKKGFENADVNARIEEGALIGAKLARKARPRPEREAKPRCPDGSKPPCSTSGESDVLDLRVDDLK